MKIIKLSSYTDQNKFFDAIAGEMLNIELSRNMLVDGAIISGQITNGYPCIIDNGIEYSIKASGGTIFIADHFNSTFITNIGAHLEKLANRYVTKASRISTIKILDNTSVLVKPKDNIEGFVRSFNERNKFIFNWNTIAVDELFNTTNPGIIFMSSIYIDVDDICLLNNNEVIFNLDKSIMKGFSSYLGLTFNLTNLSKNTILFDLTIEHSQIRDHSYLINIDKSKLYPIDYNDMIIIPVKLSTELNDTSTDICGRCREQLYDDIYAAKIIDNKFICFCVICIHYASKFPIVKNYNKLYKTKHPRTIKDKIENFSKSDIEKDVRVNALTSFEKKTYICGNNTIIYYCIGNKYLGVNCLDWLLTKMSVDPQFANKQIVEVNEI